MTGKVIDFYSEMIKFQEICINVFNFIRFVLFPLSSCVGCLRLLHCKGEEGPAESVGMEEVLLL